MNYRDNILAVIGTETFTKTITTVAIILILWLTNRIVLRILNRKVHDLKLLYSWRKTITYILFFIGIFLVSRVWFEGIQSLATYFGLLSAGIAIALKDLVTNLAGWVYIAWRRPFEVGNRIQVGEISGDVIDLRPFQFTVLEIGNWVKADQSTGRIVHIPNGSVFTQPVVNYDKGFQFIWNEIPVLITFESNWQKTKQILQEIADKNAMAITPEAENQIKNAARKFLIFYQKLTPKVYTSVEDSGVLLTIRYLTEIRKRRGSAEAMWEDILTEFGKNNDIDLAYPTQRRVK